MKSRDRQRVCRAAVESLEGRALLSGSGAGAFKHTVATALRTPHVHVAHAGSHGAANPSIVFLRAARRANALALRHDLSIPENVAGGQTTPTVASLSASSPSSISITSIPGRATNRAAVLNSGAALTPNIVMTAPVSHQSASVPISVGAPVVASSQPAIAVTPTTTAATATPTTTAAATATPTTTTAAASPTTATPTTATAVPTPPPAPPMQGNLLGGVTLTPTDVAGVKSAVDAFASAYTGGATPATDSAAVTAFRTAIQGVDATIFAETRVVGASSVTAFQQAVDQFAASYTSGKNAAADVAAWSSLETALGAFGKAVDAPSSTAGSSVPVANTPMTGPLGGMTPPRTGPLGGVGAGNRLVLTFLLDGIVSNPTLTKAQATSLQTAIDAFASSYTSGVTPATDATAVQTLRTSLNGLMPAPTSAPNSGMNFGPALTEAQATAFRSAVDTFAASYTGGASVSTDTAAVAALKSSLGTIAPANPSGTTSSPNPWPGRPPQGVGIGSVFGLVSHETLTTDQAATLKAAVDAFASAYTGGTSASTDASASQALETALQGLMPAGSPNPGNAPPPGTPPNGMG